MHGDVEVARRRTAQPGLTLAREPNALPVFDTRGDAHVDGARSGGDAGPPAFVTRVLDDGTAAAAFGARFGEPERALVAVDDAGAVTAGADLRAGTRPGPAAVAVGARRRAGEPQRHRHALGGLEEVEFGLGLEVVAPPRPAGSRLGAAAEQPAEQVTDVGAAGLPGGIEQVTEVELGTVGAVAAEARASIGEASTEPAAGEEPTGLVVLLALGVVGQHFLGLGGGLVPLLGARIVRVPVRVVLGEDLARGALDLVLGGVGGDAQLLVEVLLNPFTLGH